LFFAGDLSENFWLQDKSKKMTHTLIETEHAAMVRKNQHVLLDELKLWLSQATLSLADLKTIRAKSLSNLQRWRAQGTWGPVYDEWWELMTHASDDHVIGIMTGNGDEPNRLRQSIPYTGIVDEETRLKLLAKYQIARAANEKVEEGEHGHENM
jgi:hypothetical protein